MQHHSDTTVSLATQPFKLPRSAYERYVAARWLRSRGWWIIGVPIAAAAGVGIATSDLRWIFIALIYIFIIAPGIIAMAYFRYLLTPEARLTALLKRLTITPGKCISVHYETAPDDADVDADATAAPLPPDETLPWEDVTAIRSTGRYFVIEMRPTPYPKFIIIPRQAIDPIAQQQFLALLTTQQLQDPKK